MQVADRFFHPAVLSQFDDELSALLGIGIGVLYVRKSGSKTNYTPIRIQEVQ
jgi:hypothetical protein